jgi:hypothetical protein
MSGRCLYFFPANDCIEAGTAQLLKHAITLIDSKKASREALWLGQ